MVRILALTLVAVAAAAALWLLGDEAVVLPSDVELGRPDAPAPSAPARALPSAAQGAVGEVGPSVVVPPRDAGRKAEAGAADRGDEGTTIERPERTGPWLRGRVFDNAARPIADAHLELLPVLAGRRSRPAHVGRLSPFAISDVAGEFEVQFVDQQPRDLVVTARGHSPSVIVVDPAKLPGELIVRLSVGAVIEGRVVGAGFGFEVELWIPGPTEPHSRVGLGPGPVCPGGHFVARSRVDAAGRFGFRDVPPGPVVVGVAPQHGAVRQRCRLVAGEVRKLELTSLSPGRVEGFTKPGAEIALYSGAINRFVTANARGAFEFADVPPGRYLLAAVAEPFASSLHAVVQEFEIDGRSTLARLITVEAGRAVVVESLELRPVTGSVTGLAWVAGRHAAGAAVVMRPQDGTGARVRRAQVDAQGAFRIAAVPVGRYDAELVLPDQAAAAVKQACVVVAGGEATVTLIAR